MQLVLIGVMIIHDYALVGSGPQATAVGNRDDPIPVSFYCHYRHDHLLFRYPEPI